MDSHIHDLLYHFLYSVLFLIITLLLDVITDFYLIEVKNKSPKHITGAILRILGIALSIWILRKDLNSWQLSFYTATCFSFFWIFFDLILNLLRGKEWYYIGISSDKDEDSWIDTLLESYNGKKVFFYKVGIFIFFLLITVILILYGRN